MPIQRKPPSRRLQIFTYRAPDVGTVHIPVLPMLKWCEKFLQPAKLHFDKDYIDVLVTINDLNLDYARSLDPASIWDNLPIVVVTNVDHGAEGISAFVMDGAHHLWSYFQAHGSPVPGYAVPWDLAKEMAVDEDDVIILHDPEYDQEEHDRRIEIAYREYVKKIGKE